MKNILLIYRGRVFDSEIKPRLEQFKDTNVNIILVTENNLTRNLISYLIRDYKQKITLLTVDEFLNDNIITKFMKFKKILGNPPYQDGTQDGGQNKIYMPICKKALSLLDVDGEIDFTTPTSVLKKSKRFSLLNVNGLCEIDFTSNDSFKEGVDICSWVVNKLHDGDVKIINSDKTIRYTSKSDLIDTSKIDINFFNLYKKLKEITNKPDDRMFSQNAVDTKTGRRKEKTSIFKYPIYKLDKGKFVLIQYNKPKPKFYNKDKFVISMTKSLSNESIIVTNKDFDVAHLCISIDHQSEADNIKSFIFSDYFKKHSEMWKSTDGYGYNYALKYLPPFDKTKSWTNNEVKEFIESFLND